MTYIEKFVQLWARKNAERIRVERLDDMTARIILGTRHVDVPMSNLILQEEALRAIGQAVDQLFGFVPTPPEEITNEA